ncbi:polysaccharide deacetylase family protein [Flavobacterium silvaticum]|uniref:Polysaccharide deacetylase family protein n=1 Tax=Flavobacterium silvaticum TaxID=1852020 RepID=A0A972FP50_9FLAO|nr:polysaccharide deacetylase family protein [Flavobacterium silvaticum]NMH29641.1 polysaccharide deacetylase family protein [Flavobacterium silvaticum]
MAPRGSFRKQSVFPYYHLITDVKLPHISQLYPYKGDAVFLSDLEILTSNYHQLELKDLGNDTSPENGFLLTFDDGLREIYTHVYPVLKQKGIKAAFFLNPDFVDNNQALYKHEISVLLDDLDRRKFPSDLLRQIADILEFKFSDATDFRTKILKLPYAKRGLLPQALKIADVDISAFLKNQKPYITTDEIREMIADGFYFGGHTMSHPPLQQLSLEEQKKQIIDSIEWVKSNFGIPYSIFAFPFSDKPASEKLVKSLLDYDPEILIFGNSGLKKDISPRIIQRFSIEDPSREIQKVIGMENLYKVFNKITGNYKIRRK